MSRQQPRHLAIIAGVVAAAAMSISGTLASPRTDAALSNEAMTAAVIRESSSAANAALPPLRDLQAIKRAQVPLASVRRNPFQVGTSAAPTPAKDAARGQLLSALSALRLESVLCTETSRGCSINGKTLVEGDSVGRFTIEKINGSLVSLKSGGYRFELRVQP